jgi:hypothetical protein
VHQAKVEVVHGVLGFPDQLSQDADVPGVLVEVLAMFIHLMDDGLM